MSEHRHANRKFSGPCQTTRILIIYLQYLARIQSCQYFILRENFRIHAFQSCIYRTMSGCKHVNFLLTAPRQNTIMTTVHFEENFTIHACQSSIYRTMPTHTFSGPCQITLMPIIFLQDYANLYILWTMPEYPHITHVFTGP